MAASSSAASARSVRRRRLTTSRTTDRFRSDDLRGGMRRLMRDEWQFGLGQISSLQRHPKPEISTGPPHPGAEMTTPTPDNAASATQVAWLDLSRLTEKNMVYATGFKVNEAQSPLYSAATVTALEAEVERLQRALTLANGWNGDPQVSARTAVENANALTDIQRQRADAAERRVAELEGVLASVIADASWRTSDNTLWPRLVKAMQNTGAGAK